MVRSLLFIFTLLALWSTHAFGQKSAGPGPEKQDLKFLDNISFEVPFSENTDIKPAGATTVKPAVATTTAAVKQQPGNFIIAGADIEKADELQFKYALLMDVEVEKIRNTRLFTRIDEWYGTRYRLGGTGKEGIDCSALMQILFASVYGTSIPRTAREQYNFSRRISRTELREGDLVFFNTTGGVSHVGLYLGNNKFLHASTSGGVTISDLFEDYYSRRFIGVGRIDISTAVSKSQSSSD